tara:strand:+ start:285 stop:713 length:429 start_codon:yes stop_codon:yes gene_type:complete
MAFSSSATSVGKIIYKNHCTPQERVDFSSGNRFYLDSDCGRKLTGVCETTVTLTSTYYGTGTLAGGANVTLESSRVVDFAFVKNTGDTNSLTINIGGDGAFITLKPGESFASEIDNNAGGVGDTVRLDSASGTTYEYLLGDR